jgi:acetyl esterase/lipase
VRVDDDGTVHLSARSIPLPCSVSDEARAELAAPRRPRPAFPPLRDKELWTSYIETVNELLEPGVNLLLETNRDRAMVKSTTIGGVTVHVGTPVTVAERSRDRVWINVHGGAFIYGAGRRAQAEAVATAAEWECVVYSIDYRVPPDHPYPAALDDVVTVYRELLQRHEARNIVISGESAGGNLGLAAVLKARDAGLSVPGALILASPQCDLTESGDTFHTLRHIDCRLPVPMPEPVALYAAGRDLTEPLLSPLFAHFGAGFPPTYIQSGTRDLFLSNCVRLHRALRNAGIDAELHVWEAAPHGGFTSSNGTEAAEAHAEQARFLTRHENGLPQKSEIASTQSPTVVI